MTPSDAAARASRFASLSGMPLMRIQATRATAGTIKRVAATVSALLPP